MFRFFRNCIYFLFLVFFTILSSCIEKEEIESAKPNILFFLIDDQRNDVFSFAGHPIVQTPTVDSLAENGMIFNNAFVTTSICAASRASILTGLYESSHGYTFGKEPLDEKIMTKSYPSLLKKAGYRTGFVGKFGVKLEHQDSMLNEMFDFYKPSPINAPHFVEQEDGNRKHSMEIAGEQAIEFIKAQSKEQSFCLSISFNAVHAVDSNKEPGNAGHYPYPSSVVNLYEGLEMPLPDLHDPEIFTNHPDFLKNSLNRERYFWRWDTPEKYQINMQAYYRMISGYDKVIEEVISTIRKEGLDENTVIVFSSDNGYYMGNRGFAGKWSHYEESLRIPMIIYDPRAPKSKRGVSFDKLVLNIDLASTFLELAGINVPSSYQGLSMISEEGENDRDFFFIEHQMEHKQIPKYIGIRGKQFVYANYYDQEPSYEYLHDLEKDPDQLINLAENQEYLELLGLMRKKCEEMKIELDQKSI